MAASSQIKTLILIAFLVLLTGLAILLVLLFGEGEEISSGQIALIALILLLWPAGILLLHFRRKRKARAAAADEAPEEPAQKGYEHLSRGAEEAVQWLQSSNLGQAGNGSSAYALPWFLMIGPPGSGKTSLLLSSGLSFSALPSQRRRDQNLLRPTAACDWRMTSSAVLIDTAGRYHSENASHKEDHQEWLGLLETFRRHRRQRLLDGIVVTVSAVWLLTAGEADIEQQAAMLRARIDEVIKHNGSQLPVYLVFTHADGLPGFADFFSTLSPAERTQVWGATIPLAQARAAHEQFDSEFELLLDALMQRRLLRLSSASAPVEQLHVFDFPLRVREMRHRFGRFTNALFRPNPFSELPLLRGFYFTCSPAPAKDSQPAAEGEADGVRVTGQGFFVADLFGEVLPRDRNLAASFAQSQAQPNRMRRILIAAAALGALCLLLLVGMLVSFLNNRSLVAEAETAGQAVLRRLETARAAGQTTAVSEDELRDLSALRQTIVRLDEYDQRWITPLLSRFGLYTGGRINPRLHEIYFDFVSQRFFRPAVTRLEGHLASTSPAAAPGADAAATSEGELDRYYNKLKAYLMLESQERVQQDELQKQLADYWPEPGQKENLAFLAAEASSHTDDDPRVPRFRTSPDVVTGARDKLVSYPASSRVYNQLLARISQRLRKNNEAELVDLRKITEGQGTDYFEVSNPQPVPGAFTKESYYKYVLGNALPTLIEEARSEDYVTGQAGAQNVDLKVIRDRYFRDYATHWKSFVESITISRKQLETKEKTEEMLERLSAPNSPLIFLMDRVSYQTNLAEPPVTGGLLGWIKGFFASKTPIGDNQAVQATFGPLHTFMSEKGENSPSAQYLKALEGLRAKLREVDGNWEKVAERQRVKDLGIKQSEDAVRSALGQMKDTPAGGLMLQPVDAVREAIFRGNYEELVRRWSQLYPQARNLEVAFPFAETSTDVPVQDLNDFFNPGSGRLQEFLNLAKEYFTVQGEQWQLKNTARERFSDRFVSWVNNALRLQAALFQNGQLKVDASLTLEPGPDVEIVVDGKSINSAEKRSDSFSWPNTSGARIVSRTGGTPLEFPKSWGLYRMFVKGGGDARRVGRGYQLVWRLDNGTIVTAQLEPQTSKNPFDLSLFRQLRAPASLTQ